MVPKVPPGVPKHIAPDKAPDRALDAAEIVPGAALGVGVAVANSGPGYHFHALIVGDTGTRWESGMRKP